MCDTQLVKKRSRKADTSHVEREQQAPRPAAPGANTEVGQCTHCKRPVPPDLGVENSHGEVLCGPCYLVLFKRRTRPVSGEATVAG